MGRDIATDGASRRRFGAVGLLVPLTLLALVSCGSSGDDGPPAALSETSASSSTEPEGTPSCTESRHSVVLDFAGFLTDGSEDDMWIDWITGAANPAPRPGTVELTHAYADRGYEVIYVTTAPPNVLIEGRPVPEAAQEWIQTNGYAFNESARVIGYNGTDLDAGAPVLSITSELIRLGTEDHVAHDVGYTDNRDKAHAMAAGGVPLQGLYMIGEEAGSEGTTAIINGDMAAHLAQIVEPLPAVCTPG
jgi:hypothetical protein